MTLTARRQQILQLIADGLNDRQISVRLHVSADTVRKTNHAMYAVLGATGRAHAVAIAYRAGLLGDRAQEG